MGKGQGPGHDPGQAENQTSPPRKALILRHGAHWGACAWAIQPSLRAEASSEGERLGGQLCAQGLIPASAPGGLSSPLPFLIPQHPAPIWSGPPASTHPSPTHTGIRLRQARPPGSRRCSCRQAWPSGSHRLPTLSSSAGHTGSLPPHPLPALSGVDCTRHHQSCPGGNVN